MCQLGMMAPTYNTSTQDAEPGGWRVQNQPRLHSETLNQKIQTKTANNNNLKPRKLASLHKQQGTRTLSHSLSLSLSLSYCEPAIDLSA
jgi:hypothetical protein